MIRTAIITILFLASPLALADSQELASVIPVKDSQDIVAADGPSFFVPKTENDIAAMASTQFDDVSPESTPEH